MQHASLFVGIDISKLKHDIAVLAEDKKPVAKPLVIKDDYAGYQQLLGHLQTLAEQFQTQEFYIGMEATADYWKNLYFFLKKHADNVHLTLINPVQTRAFAKTELRRAKTDPVNAKDIALFMVEKRPRPSVDRPRVFDNLKDIDKRIYQINKQKTMLTNKLRLELCKVAPEIEKATRYIQGFRVLALLAQYPSAEAIAKASVTELAQIKCGHRNWSLPLPFIEKMHSLVQNSVAYKSGPGAEVVVQSLVQSILDAQRDIDSLQKQSLALYKTIRTEDSLLATIPGIRLPTAIALEAYIGDVNRFATAKQFIAYFGMNPTVNRSGLSKRASYLEKKGNPIVRHKLFMAALCMVSRQKEPIYSYYMRMVAAGKPKLVALCAAMRKLLNIIFSMLKNQKPFDNQSQICP